MSIIFCKFLKNEIHFLAIWSWYLLWCVWPYGSRMAALIFLAYINLCTTSLVVYYIMSTMSICMWYNALLHYIGTVVQPTENINRLRFPLCDSLFNISHRFSLWPNSLRVRLTSNLWNFLFVLHQLIWRLTWLGVLWIYIQSLCYLCIHCMYCVGCHHQEVVIFCVIYIFDRFFHRVILNSSSMY